MQHKEYELQKQICQYIRYQYPNVFFLSDTIASVKLTMSQAVRNKAIQNNEFHCPDLLILQPNKQYHGLCLELKIESPYKRNGELKTSEHLQNQGKTIYKLNKLGYKALFVWSFEQAKKEIDNYILH